MIGAARRLVLASRSPRRLELLRDAGYLVRVTTTDVDDGVLVRPADGTSPRRWVTALAYLKARAVQVKALDAHREAEEMILAADTVCIHGDDVLGQPRDAADARRMITGMRSAVHETITGVCLLSWCGKRRVLFADSAQVDVGPIDDDTVDAYIASEGWRGKAGGYNLSERIAAGWPIEVIGDPATVMGVPLRRLGAAIDEWSTTAP